MHIRRRVWTLLLGCGLLTLAMSVYAAKGGKPDKPGGDGGPSLKYTAGLSGGGFRFSAVDVAPTFKGDQLKTIPGSLGFDIQREDGEVDDGYGPYNLPWNTVFQACEDLLNYSAIVEFPGGDLLISASGGVRIAFPDLIFKGTEVMSDIAGAEVTMQLIGTTEFSSGESLLPTAEEGQKVYELTHFSIWGRSLKGGGGPRKSCGGSLVKPLNSTPSTLTITADPPS